MAKYKEIVYSILDLIHETSDDSTLTEEHIMFLASNYRSFLLKQKYYSDIKKEIPKSNYQTLCFDLEKVDAVEGIPCEGFYLKTTQKIPETMPFGTQRVFPAGVYYNGDIAFITPERMRYIGYNKWTKNLIFASLSPERYLYLTSGNAQYQYLKQASFSAVFEKAEEASEMECEKDSSEDSFCDIMDKEFPLEDALIPPLIELVLKQVAPTTMLPQDKDNNAKDDLPQKAIDIRQ